MWDVKIAQTAKGKKNKDVSLNKNKKNICFIV